MKILIYGINFYPEIVGVGKYTSELAQFLQSKKDEIRVITTHEYYPSWKSKKNNYSKEVFKNCLVYRCPIYVPNKPNGFKRILHLITFAISSLPILFIQKKWQPDLIMVILPTILSGNNLLLFKDYLFPNSKLWLHIQDLEIDVAHKLKIINLGIIKRFLIKWEKQIFSKFNVVSAISEDMKLNILRKGITEEKLFLLRNWSEINSKRKAEKNIKLISEFHLEKFLSKNDFVIMYSGSLNKKQDINLLMNSIRITLRKKNIKWILSIEGPSSTILKNCFGNNKDVLITGLKSANKLQKWLSLADLHVLPQKADINTFVMPSKLIGIMACGRPVIATDLGSNEFKNIVNKIGIITPAGEIDDFVKAIFFLFENKDLRVKLGNNANSLAIKYYEKNLILNNLYKKIIALVKKKN